MRVSLKSLMLFVAAVCVALTLTQMDFLLSGGVLIAIVVIANLLLSAHAWRCAAYGAVAGILFCLLMMFAYIRIDPNGIVASAQTRNPASAVIDPCKSYVLHFGALVGGTMGLILFGNRTKPVHTATPVEILS